MKVTYVIAVSLTCGAIVAGGYAIGGLLGLVVGLVIVAALMGAVDGAMG